MFSLYRHLLLLCIFVIHFCSFFPQIEDLKSRLKDSEKQSLETPDGSKSSYVISNGSDGSPPTLPKKPLQNLEAQKTSPAPTTGVIVCLRVFRSKNLRRPSENGSVFLFLNGVSLDIRP